MTNSEAAAYLWRRGKAGDLEMKEATEKAVAALDARGGAAMNAKQCKELFAELRRLASEYHIVIVYPLTRRPNG